MRKISVRQARFGALTLGLTVAVAAAGLSGCSSSGPSYPAHWDARVAPITAEVAKLRGLVFEHPVTVRFLSDKAFEKTVTSDASKQTTESKQETRIITESYRAIGLIHGDPDLFKADNALQGSDVLAYYDDDTKSVTIKGTKLDVATKATLAHEFTHALQDQHFDLTKLKDTASKDNTDNALTALLEGDAVRIENDYVASLSQADQAAYNKSQNDSSGGSGGAKSSTAPDQLAVGKHAVPLVLALDQQAPYDFGPQLVDLVLAKRGESGVNKLFVNPPTTEQQIIYPAVLLDGSKTIQVAAPALGAGEKELRKPDPFGTYTLYLMLASRLDTSTAIAASNAWGGDAEHIYSKKIDGVTTTCVRANFAGRSAADTKTIGTALAAWAAKMPGAHPPTVKTTAALATLDACDPGTKTAAAPNDLTMAEGILLARNEFVQEVIKDAPTVADAACFGNHLAMNATMNALINAIGNGEPTAAQQNEITNLAADAARACGAG
jgi:hypothetical protein